MRGVAIVALTLSGCAPTKLLKATVDYATVTDTVAATLRDAPGLLTQLCRDRLEIEYLTLRAIPGQQPPPLESWIDVPHATAAGNFQITWRQRCAALSRAEDGFGLGLQGIRDYARALATFAAHEIAPDSGMANLASAAGDDAVKLSADATPYHDAIAGLGGGLSKLAKQLVGNWQGKKIGSLVERADPSFRQTLGGLEAFIVVVRNRHLVDARRALAELVEALDTRRTDGDLAIGRFDIAMTDHLDHIDRQLLATLHALETLADAHAQLVAGWDKGESFGLETLEAIASLAGEAYHDVSAFR